MESETAPTSMEPSTDPVTVDRLPIPTARDHLLAATLYRPAQSPATGLVIINSAVGARQSLYRWFARFLAEHGFEVLTYDYRGIGESKSLPTKSDPVRMRDWGQVDLTAVIEWCREHRPGTRPWAVGHSVGGQLLGLAANNQHVAGLVGICAQKTHWSLWPMRDWFRLVTLWYVIMPTLTRGLGYFPSSWFQLGEPLPPGVAYEWSQWARARGYIPEVVGPHVAAQYADYGGSFLAYSFEDDRSAPHAAVQALVDFYASADGEHRHVRPADVGRPIGHFGFFKREFRDTLWAEVLDWLTRQSNLPETRVQS